MNSAARRVLVLTALCTVGPLHAQEIATPAPQGTEGHFCKSAGFDKAALYRRHDLFFCVVGKPRFPSRLVIAVVGPDRADVERMLLDAFDETRAATDFTAASGSAPDMLVVAAAHHPSAAEVRAALTAQGFTIDPTIDAVIRTYDNPQPSTRYGMRTGGWYGADRALHVAADVPADRLTEAEARDVAMRALGIGAMLIEPMKVFPDGRLRWSEDPRTFVPAKTHAP